MQRSGLAQPLTDMPPVRRDRVGGGWAVAFLFLGSGAAALIYELVWYQWLRYTVGASSVSLALTLGSFMAGLGAGAWLAPRLIGTHRHPLRVYAALELGIGAFGLVMGWLIPALGLAYAQAFTHLSGDAAAAVSGWAAAGVLGRGAVCALALVPPAMLMGATLPVVARWVQGTAQGAARLGGYYAINTLGAMVGVLLGGFALLPNLTLGQVSVIAAALNAVVAAWAWGLAARKSPRKSPRTSPPEVFPEDAQAALEAGQAPKHRGNAGETGVWDSSSAGGATGTLPQPLPGGGELGAGPGPLPGGRGGWGGWAVLGVMVLSGMTALGAQVVWTRVLSAILHVTVYTFAIILAVFLLGLAVGGGVGSAVLRRTRRPGVALAVTQLLLVPAVAWAFWFIAVCLPGWNGWWGYGGNTAWARFGGDFNRVAAALLPATLCWGASLPLAIAAAGWGEQGVGGRGVGGQGVGERGRLVGRVYGANTLGAIAGALGVGLVVLPAWGSDFAAHLLVAVAGCNGVLLLGFAGRNEPLAVVEEVRGLHVRVTPMELLEWLGRRVSGGVNGLHGLMRRGVFLKAAAVWLLLVGVGAGAWWTPGVPEKLLVRGRMTGWPNHVLDSVEGMHAVAAVATTEATGLRELWVSGKVVASSEKIDMRLQRMLGHLAAIAHGDPRSVLIVGLGTGTTAGCFVDHPGIERIVICEIEPEVVGLARKYFSQENRGVLDDPRTQVVFDDARHFLATTDERFDIITSDPIHPWVKGASALYSREYYALVKARLNPGGVVSQWVPFYETSEAAVRSMLATFFDGFAHGTLWHAGEPGVGYDTVMLAKPDAPRLDVGAWARWWEDGSAARSALAEVQIASALDLCKRLAGDAAGLREWLASAELNADHALRLEYLAGMSRRSGESAVQLYGDLIEQRTMPASLVMPEALRKAVASAWVAELEEAGLR